MSKYELKNTKKVVSKVFICIKITENDKNAQN